MGPFQFCTERRLVRLTGRRAATLDQLLGHMREVSGSSIFYHTHHLYLSHHFVTPVFYNDFANWVMQALQERELGEKLAAVDMLAFTTVRGLRNAMVDEVSEHVDRSVSAPRRCPPGEEFHFLESQSFVMPTGLVAEDVPALFRALPRVSNVSLYYHFFESRLRLDRPTNDFSAWLVARGERQLAEAIDRLDPYLVTLDELKAQIAALGPEHQKGAHDSPHR